MYRTLPLIALAFAVSIGTGEAQSSAARAPSVLSPASATFPAEAVLLSAQAQDALVREGGFARPRSLVFGVVGGLIGAGTGFLVSQVMRSDWDKTTNSTFAAHRRSFAISGAALGTATAFVVAGTTSPVPIRYVGSSGAREGSGGPITSVELENSSARNAYEAVAALRPQWLVVRGTTLGSAGTLVVNGDENEPGPPQITAVPGRGRIGAFLDGMALENLEALRDVPLISVERIEFRTASVGPASGPGHIQRAIVVITADGRTE